MHYLLYLRSQYGSVFATELPDGRIVPWRPLSIGEFSEYDSLLKMGRYPRVAIEDEIFSKCILDKVIVQGMGDIKAGVISAVVAAILSVSGPDSPEEMNLMMNYNRMQAGEVIPFIVSVICQAFPAYKPEEVYAMDYSTLMARLAQAEHKLLRTGMLNEPLRFERIDQPTSQQRQSSQKPKVDSSVLFEKYYEPKQPKSTSVKTSSKETTVISEMDVAEHTTHYTGHEVEDRIILEAQMVDETGSIYKDYLEQMRNGEKVTIPSHEERMAAAKKRMEANRQKASAIAKAKKEEELEIQRAVAKAKAEKRVAVKKKR